MKKAKYCLISNYIRLHVSSVNKNTSQINTKSVYTIHNTDVRGVLEVLKIRRGYSVGNYSSFISSI